MLNLILPPPSGLFESFKRSVIHTYIYERVFNGDGGKSFTLLISVIIISNYFNGARGVLICWGLINLLEWFNWRFQEAKLMWNSQMS